MTTGPILCAVFLGPSQFRMQFPGDSFKLCQQILEILVWSGFVDRVF